MKAVKLFLILFLSLALCASFSLAESQKNVAEVMYGSFGLSWTPKVKYTQLVLTVSTPGGKVFRKVFDAGSTPGFDLSDLEGPVLDGSYTYQLQSIPTLPKANLRDNKRIGVGDKFAIAESFTQTGHFTVLNGGIVNPYQQEGLSGTADQVILDDLIVDGSLCVGQDCVNGESFGFDTLRLKENNLRIRFVDTSNTSSFPSRDWQITVNESSNGGANKFSIDDIDGGRTPFTIEAGAPSNSLYVDDGGRVGFGTATPVADLHVENGNTPTLRLEQDGSSGFAAQTWDVAGNEANFFIRDATNGSTLPFRIRPGAPSSSIDVLSDGRIAIGSDSNTAGVQFEVHGGSTDTYIAANRGGGGTIAYFSAADTYVGIGAATTDEVRFVTSGTAKMTLTDGGNLTMAIGGGSYDPTQGWLWTSSRESKKDIRTLDAREAIDAVKALEPVTYRYKISSHEDKNVGFIAENVPELVATRTGKNLNPMDIVAVLTKVVKEQQKAIEQLKKEVKELKKKK